MRQQCRFPVDADLVFDNIPDELIKASETMIVPEELAV